MKPRISLWFHRCCVHSTCGWQLEVGVCLQKQRLLLKQDHLIANMGVLRRLLSFRSFKFESEKSRSTIIPLFSVSTM